MTGNPDEFFLSVILTSEQKIELISFERYLKMPVENDELIKLIENLYFKIAVSFPKRNFEVCIPNKIPLLLNVRILNFSLERFITESDAYWRITYQANKKYNSSKKIKQFFQKQEEFLVLKISDIFSKLCR